MGWLCKDFQIHLSREMLRQHVLAVSGQMKQNLNSVDGDRKFDDLEDQKLYGYVDGVMINILGQGWKEVKLLRYEDEKNKNICHRGLLGSASVFGQMVRREAINIGASKADELVFLMDGADGFHNHIKKNLPTARQIVDYWHACQHIGQCAEILHGNDQRAAGRWRSNYCHVLREKGAGELISRLRQSRARLEGERSAAVCKLLKYLQLRAERMSYHQLLADGYRIDSGPIESSCKKVVQARMKGSGMRWSRRGASAMLEIRCALFSNHWEAQIRKSA